MELIPLNETSEQAFLNGEDLSVPWDSSSYGDNPDGTTRVGFGNLIPGDLTLDKNGNIIISIHNPTRESFTLTQKRLGPHQFVCQNSEGNDVQCMINPHILLFAINSLRGAEHIQVMFFAQGFKDYRDRNSIPPSMTRDEVASLGITYLEPGVRGTHTPPINGSKVKNAAMGYWRDEYLFEATFDRGIEFFLFKTFPYQLQAPTNS
jgi:hypothetical protein